MSQQVIEGTENDFTYSVTNAGSGARDNFLKKFNEMQKQEEGLLDMSKKTQVKSEGVEYQGKKADFLTYDDGSGKIIGGFFVYGTGDGENRASSSIFIETSDLSKAAQRAEQE